MRNFLFLQAGNIERKSTKQWAQENGYSTQKLFQKFFNDDIKYLLSMDKLWAKRRPPTPLDWYETSFSWYGCYFLYVLF
jgi:ubiquitin-like 1-activating enzyme E1 B